MSNDSNAISSQEAIRLLTTGEQDAKAVTVYNHKLELVGHNDMYEAMDVGIADRFKRQGTHLSALYLDSALHGLFGNGDPYANARARLSAVSNGPLIASELLQTDSGRQVEIQRFRIEDGGICATFTEAPLAVQPHLNAVANDPPWVVDVLHDLRNLVQVAQSNMELALREDMALSRPFRPENSDTLRAMRRARELLMRAFGQDAPVVVTAPVVDLCGIVESVDKSLQAIVGSCMTVHIDLESKALFARVERVHMEAALLNLAANARDAMEPGGVLTITVKRHRTSGLAKRFVDVVFEDNGCGMSQDVVAAATQLGFTTKAPGQGTGVGLASVQRFAREHGGELLLTSTPGIGTKVVVRLPEL